MSKLEKKLQPYLDSLSTAVENKNFYAGMALAFTLPDICSKLEYPEESTNIRYPKWFDEYLYEKFRIMSKYILLEKPNVTGKDFYALRCVYLHQGTSDITTQRAQEILNKFFFVQSLPGYYSYNGLMEGNDMNKMVTLQVDVLCKDIHDAVQDWIEDNKTDEHIENRAQEIMNIFKLY